MSMNDVVKFVVISGWVLLLGSCFSIVGSVVWCALMYPDQPVSKDLIALAGTAFGFLMRDMPATIASLLPKPTASL